MGEKYYVTTPIYYPSDNLHIGHTYCTVAADTIKSFKTYQGYDARMITGSDEHGQKMEQAAKAIGIDPKTYVDKMVADTKELWETMGIDYDQFIRSTDPVHEKNVQDIFTQLYDQGDIYKGEYEGYYCTPCESFWTESQLDEGHACPDCGRETHKSKEESYFFRLSNYRDALLQLYEDQPNFLQPDFRKNEMINSFLKDGLEDLSVTRSSFGWGVPVPFDEDHVVYVWIDALACYLTAAGLGTDEEAYNRFWPADVHLVGKEIVRFHAIIWPALLMALDLPLPDQIFGHGWILFDDDKMSKSKGNIIYPEPIIDLYGVDALRYFLLREFAFGHDGSFSVKPFLQRLNTDLANDLGNLLSRTVSMLDQYNDGIIPEPGEIQDVDRDLEDLATSTLARVEKEMETFQFSRALEAIFRLVSRTNKYVDETQPWILAKEDKARLDTVLYHLAESLRIVSVLLTPFLKNIGGQIRDQLGLSREIMLEEAGTWGLTKAGTKTEKKGLIFPRLDIEKETKILYEKNQELIDKRKAEKAAVAKEAGRLKTKPEVTIDDFDKLDIRVGQVLKVEDHPNADRLYVIDVKIGTEVRTICSSLKEYYQPEDMVGKKILVLVNLKPAKMRGVLSEGMLLAAETEDGDLTLVTTMEDIGDNAFIS